MQITHNRRPISGGFTTKLSRLPMAANLEEQQKILRNSEDSLRIITFKFY